MIRVEQGLSRMDCERQIADKYRRPFQIMRERPVKIGGFLGLFSKSGVEVEFYFTPSIYKNSDVQMNLENEKRKVIAAAGKNYEQVASNAGSASNASNTETQKILETLNELKEKFNSGGFSAGKQEEHPSFSRCAELLKLNDFSDNYIEGMLDRLRKEMSLEMLDNFDVVQDYLLQWIGESIKIHKEESVHRKPRIMALVGPTGVGKTTTVAKLAAIYGIKTDDRPAVDVRMITIDAYRIGATEQLEKIGNIMHIPVCAVDNKQDLKKQIALHAADIDLFLIDTIGKSPKDSSKLGEMKEILEGCGKGAEYHLVLCVGTKTSDMLNIMQQFEPFNYRSVILTKMDETDRIGNVISALAEKGKSVSYITDGQTIPVDIRKASVVRFLINLDGFKVNREKIEDRFPSGEAEQFKWR